jgi:hypothetical protein
MDKQNTLKWPVVEITEALREAQFGDMFIRLTRRQASRFVRIGMEHGLKVVSAPAFSGNGFTASVEGAL